MSKGKDKVLIPMYQMELSGFYLLLRIHMTKKGYQNINGVGEDFFRPEIYQNGSGILANLQKREMVEERDGGILLREGLEKVLDRILESPHCMNFQNAMLQKKGQIVRRSLRSQNCGARPGTNPTAIRQPLFIPRQAFLFRFM